MPRFQDLGDGRYSHSGFCDSRGLNDRFHRRLREAVTEGAVSLYVVAGVIALGLLVYLVFALVKPEWF